MQKSWRLRKLVVVSNLYIITIVFTILSLREREKELIYVFNIIFIVDWRKRCKINKGIDESIISVFNIIFEFVLFIFEFVLFNIISSLELFYFNCKLFNFRNKYSKDWVLEKKKGIWSWFGLKIRRFGTKIWHPPS